MRRARSKLEAVTWMREHGGSVAERESRVQRAWLAVGFDVVDVSDVTLTPEYRWMLRSRALGHVAGHFMLEEVEYLLPQGDAEIAAFRTGGMRAVQALRPARIRWPRYLERAWDRFESGQPPLKVYA